MIYLTFRAANNFDMYDVMEIRNNGREFMTHNTDVITPEQQYDWWMSKDDNLYKIWLATTKLLGSEIVIGFGMLRTMPDGLVWGTLAVNPEYRGLGVGTAIYKFLAQQANDDVWIEVLEMNAASYKAALNAGYEVYYAGTDVITLVHRKG
jgi:GNAT superfamily N-acetyltransferase